MLHHNAKQQTISTSMVFQGNKRCKKYTNRKKSPTRRRAQVTDGSAQLTCICPMINRSWRSMSAIVTKEDWATPSGWSTSPRASTTLIVSTAARHSRPRGPHTDALGKRTQSPPTEQHRVHAQVGAQTLTPSTVAALRPSKLKVHIGATYMGKNTGLGIFSTWYPCVNSRT